ncbi:MAG: type II toxin-antitoxin system Phd/YefM family antitoxin [Lacisediminihabitans sp.]
MLTTFIDARPVVPPLIEKVDEDHAPIEIVSKKGSAVLMSLADYGALEETAYLLRDTTTEPTRSR